MFEGLGTPAHTLAGHATLTPLRRRRRLPKAHDPTGVGPAGIRHEKTPGAFLPEVNRDGEPFCIVIPPPNVTDVERHSF